MKKANMIKWIILFFSALPVCVSAQKGIDAIYSNLPGMAGEIFCFHRNHTYHYFAGACTSRWIDSGCYQISHDTITFYSLMHELPAETRKVRFFFDKEKEPKTDSFAIEIYNGTSVKGKLFFQLSFADSSMILSDSIANKETIRFNIAKHLLPSNQSIQLKVNNEIISVVLDGHLSFTIRLNEWIVYKPINNQLKINKNRAYPVFPNADFINTKYYIPKKRFSKKRQLRKVFQHS